MAKLSKKALAEIKKMKISNKHAKKTLKMQNKQNKAVRKHEIKKGSIQNKGKTLRHTTTMGTIGGIAGSKYDAEKQVAIEQTKQAQHSATAFQSAISQLLNPGSIKQTVSPEPDLGDNEEEKDSSLSYPDYYRR